MKFIKTTLVFLALFITNITTSQNFDIAKAYYIKAKEAYSTDNYKKAIEYLESTKNELGSTNPDITYLEILSRFKVNKKDKLVKALSKTFLENASRDDDRIQDVSLIIVEHEEIINKEIIERQNMFNLAKNYGDINRMRAFINKYSNGDDVVYIKSSLNKKETEIYNSALAENSVVSYNNYITNFPSGRYLQEINSKLKKAKEIESFNKARESEDIHAIQGHLLVYPNSKGKSVLLEILEYKLISKANNEFEKDNYSSAKNSYIEYKKKFPEGNNIAMANDNLKIIEKKLDKQSKINNRTSGNYFMLTYDSDETYGIQFGKLSQNKLGLYFNLSGNESSIKIKFAYDQEIETAGTAIDVFEEAS